LNRFRTDVTHLFVNMLTVEFWVLFSYGQEFLLKKTEYGYEKAELHPLVIFFIFIFKYIHCL